MKDAEHEFDREVRHLTRSLAEPGALRSNRLARALVTSGDDADLVRGVQGFVREALPADSRLLRIYELCDVEGRPHKAVAAEIGLSMRQFYRERQRAHAYVRDAIRARLYASAQEDGADLLADELELLHESVQCGRVAPVLRRVDELLRGGVTTGFARTLLALHACAFAVSGRSGDAVAMLTSVRPTADPADVAAEFEYAWASVFAAQGRHAEAIPRAEGAVALKRPWTELSERRRRALARRLALLGNLYHEDHDPHKAVATLELAGRILLSCRVTPQTQVVRVSTDLAVSCLAIADLVDRGTARAIEAYRAATWHGLPVERVRAQIVVGFAALAGGDAGGVLKGLPLSEYCTFAGVEGHWLARMHLLVSRLQTAHGRTDEALESVRTARASIPSDHCLRALADLRAAEALNAARVPDAALPLALGAIPRMALGGGSHFAGAAHVATADALAQLGDERGARAHCDAGIERLRQGALVMDLSRALRLAARLTGNERYAAEQRALIAG